MAVAEFDWSQVHDFDPSEAGRTPARVRELMARRTDDMPETPDHLR